LRGKSAAVSVSPSFPTTQFFNTPPNCRRWVKEASLPGGEGVYYVAVGPTKVGFFSIKRGLFKNSLDGLLVEHPRSDVREVEIKKGFMPVARFVFADGTNYVLMCPRIQHGKLKKVQRLLSTTE
jgi:hypothetical protein